MFISRTQRRGFTLVELLIILGVMSALSTIVYYNVNEARAKSRDTQRMSDLSQIHLALRLYNDTYGSYPDFPGAIGGVAVGEGTEIDSYLDPFFPRSFKDPLASTGDPNYHYVYDTDIDACYLEAEGVYASMEVASHANWSEVCGAGAGGEPVPNTYIVLTR